VPLLGAIRFIDEWGRERVSFKILPEEELKLAKERKNYWKAKAASYFRGYSDA
jgi:hypothetical protein